MILYGTFTLDVTYIEHYAYKEYTDISVMEVYGYYGVMWGTDQVPADLGYQPVCLLTHMSYL